MKKISVLCSLFLFFSFPSCNTNKKEEKEKVGKYVYIDKDGVLHTERRCTKFIFEDEKHFGIKRMSSNSIPPKYLDNTCSYCVDDDVYEILESRKGKKELPGINENDTIE